MKRTTNDQRPSSAIMRAVARVEQTALRPRSPDEPFAPLSPPPVVLMLPDDGSGPAEPPPRSVPFPRRPLPRLVVYDLAKVEAARAERGTDDREADIELFERFAINREDDGGSR